jgi:hypothetical protein
VKNARLDEIEGIALFERGLLWKPRRDILGIEAFGINAWTAENPGDEMVEEHDEPGDADPRFAAHAKSDPDFDPIREDPGFPGRP